MQQLRVSFAKIHATPILLPTVCVQSPRFSGSNIYEAPDGNNPLIIIDKIAPRANPSRVYTASKIKGISALQFL